MPAPRRTSGETAGQQALAIFRRRSLHALTLTRILQHRMLGGQALVGLIVICRLLLGVPEGLECGDRFILIGIGAGSPSASAQYFANTVAFFSLPLLVAVMTMRSGLRSTSIDPPLELVMFTTNWRFAGTRLSNPANSAAERSGPCRLIL